MNEIKLNRLIQYWSIRIERDPDGASMEMARVEASLNEKNMKWFEKDMNRRLEIAKLCNDLEIELVDKNGEL